MDQGHGDHGLLYGQFQPAPDSLENNMVERKLRSMKLTPLLIVSAIL